MDVEELLRSGGFCTDSGDLKGALDAYRQADGLGDAEAALLLGETYRKLDRPQLAEAAYVRAEARGHWEAPFCLGNMRRDLGNVEGAEAAYKRAIAAGSQMAVFNLGLMLTGAGRLDEAKSYLLQTEANGDSDALHLVGTVLEQQGDTDGAAAAYQRGAGAGDGEAAFNLGRLRHAAGDEDGARSAFQRAHELGYGGAKEILDAWDRSGSGTAGQGSRPDVSQFMTAIDAAVIELATQRSSLRRSWIADTMTVQMSEARATVLTAVAEKRLQEFSQVCNQFSVAPDPYRKQPFKVPLPTADLTEWVQLKAGARSRFASVSWELSPVQTRAFDDDIQAARKALSEARGKRFSGSLTQAAIEAITRFQKRLNVLDAAVRQVRAEVRASEQAREQSAKQHCDEAARAWVPVMSGAYAAMGELPALMQS